MGKAWKESKAGLLCIQIEGDAEAENKMLDQKRDIFFLPVAIMLQKLLVLSIFRFDGHEKESPFLHFFAA